MKKRHHNEQIIGLQHNIHHKKTANRPTMRWDPVYSSEPVLTSPTNRPLPYPTRSCIPDFQFFDMYKVTPRETNNSYEIYQPPICLVCNHLSSRMYTCLYIPSFFFPSLSFSIYFILFFIFLFFYFKFLHRHGLSERRWLAQWVGFLSGWPDLLHLI